MVGVFSSYYDMKHKILITGGSGLVGSKLSKLMVGSGYEVVHLSRRVTGNEEFLTFKWDISGGTIDESAFEGVTHMVHLAGAGVADEKWTQHRKKVILDSRVDSTKLLFQYVKKLDVKLESYISASAIGIYNYSESQCADEESDHSNTFLAEVVKKWEESADPFQDLTRVAKVRIGVVLSKEGGALKEIAKPISLYAGAPLGTGSQYTSWIHIQDLVGIFKYVIENNLQGTYNAVAPNPVTNSELTKAIAKSLNKPLILPNVPSFVMKLILGEMSDMILNGIKVSSQKIQTAGFEFAFTEVGDAVDHAFDEK